MNSRELLKECGLFVSCASDFSREQRLKLLEDIKSYLAQPETKRETVLLSDEQINEVSRNAHEFSALRKRYDFNEDKFLIGIQYAVLKANGIGKDND
jgi:hypothetical protein